MWSWSQTLRVGVTERLNEIFALVEGTIAEYEEELCRFKEENRRKQQLLDQLLSSNVLMHRASGAVPTVAELGLEQELPVSVQVKEEPEEQSSEPHNERLRAVVTERLAAVAEEIFALVERTIAEYEEELCRSKEENQRKQQLLDLDPHKGEEDHGSETPSEEAPLAVKLENYDDPQLPEALWLQVKVEDPDEVPIASVTSESPTHAHLYEHDYQGGQLENIESWQIAVYDDTEPERVSGRRLRVRTKTSDVAKAQQYAPVVKKKKMKKKMKEPYCKACNKMFASFFELKKHMDNHAAGRHHSCPVCWKAFSRETYVQTHLRKVHLGQASPKAQETEFRCSVCSMQFSSSYNLKKHMYQHTGRRIYGCSLCEQTFKRKYELKRHYFYSHSNKRDDGR